jgi:hypothetical protein
MLNKSSHEHFTHWKCVNVFYIFQQLLMSSAIHDKKNGYSIGEFAIWIILLVLFHIKAI